MNFRDQIPKGKAFVRARAKFNNTSQSCEGPVDEKVAEAAILSLALGKPVIPPELVLMLNHANPNWNNRNAYAEQGS